MFPPPRASAPSQPTIRSCFDSAGSRRLSQVVTTSSRQPTPPVAFTCFANPSMASMLPWNGPGASGDPTSADTWILIVSGVTPTSVASSGAPSSPPAAGAAVLDGVWPAPSSTNASSVREQAAEEIISKATTKSAMGRRINLSLRRYRFVRPSVRTPRSPALLADRPARSRSWAIRTPATRPGRRSVHRSARCSGIHTRPTSTSPWGTGGCRTCRPRSRTGPRCSVVSSPTMDPPRPISRCSPIRRRPAGDRLARRVEPDGLARCGRA